MATATKVLTLNRFWAVLLVSAILILLVTLQVYLNGNFTSILPSPVTYSPGKSSVVPSATLRQISSGELFVVANRDGAYRVQRILNVDVDEIPPFVYEQDGDLLREIRKKNNSNLRFDAYIPPWFDRSDVLRMELVSNGNISSAFSVDRHIRLKEVIFEDSRGPAINSFGECVDQCGVQKSAEDIHEVYAFHLDRVLGLNRVLPTVARRFGGNETDDAVFEAFGSRFSDGKCRPIVWWDPHIRHSGTLQPDQNSMSLWWTDYQRELANRCFARENMEESELNVNCTAKIRHIEWGKLAIYDFLLQNHDRIDRSFCGYDRDEGEPCFTNGLYDNECIDIQRQHLVHIFTHTQDESRLVFIDNVFNLNRSAEHLNYRLLEGIQEIPEYPISVLKSGKFQDLMLQSLYIDKVYWEEQGGRPFVEKLINVTEKRAHKLITYINRTGISLVPDY